MDYEIQWAIQLTIIKWIASLNSLTITPIEFSNNQYTLCKTQLEHTPGFHPCQKCIIYKKTLGTSCRNTPYADILHSEARFRSGDELPMRQAIIKQIDFLRSLLPDET